MEDRSSSGKDDVDLNNTCKEKQHLINEILIGFPNQGTVVPNGGRQRPDLPQPTSHKRQVDESRPEFKAFLEVGYDYLSKRMKKEEQGIAYVLAADVARQMCNKQDDGEKITEARIRHRCWKRSREHLKP